MVFCSCGRTWSVRSTILVCKQSWMRSVAGLYGLWGRFPKRLLQRLPRLCPAGLITLGHSRSAERSCSILCLKCLFFQVPCMCLGGRLGKQKHTSGGVGEFPGLRLAKAHTNCFPYYSKVVFTRVVNPDRSNSGFLNL